MAKVLFIGPLPPPIGGTRIQVKILVEALEASGPHVDKVIPLDVTPGRVRNMFLQLSIFLAILWNIPRFKVIAFHANPLRIAFWGPIFLLLARLLKKKMQFRFLGGDLDIILEEKKWLKPSIRFISLADQLVFETKGLIAYWKEHIASDSNLIWFPNSRYPLEGSHKRPQVSGKISLIFAGHVKREKGVGLICESYERFNKMHPDKVSITLVGRCEDPELEKEIKKSNLNFLGEVSHEETVGQMYQHHAFIFPTYWKGEGHPGVLIEAMQAGLPLLCADWRFVGELVDDGYNGRLYEPKNVDAIVSVLEELIESPERLDEMSANSLEFVKKYDAEYWMKEMFPEALEQLKK